MLPLVHTNRNIKKNMSQVVNSEFQLELQGQQVQGQGNDHQQQKQECQSNNGDSQLFNGIPNGSETQNQINNQFNKHQLNLINTTINNNSNNNNHISNSSPAISFADNNFQIVNQSNDHKRDSTLDSTPQQNLSQSEQSAINNNAASTNINQNNNNMGKICPIYQVSFSMSKFSLFIYVF
jgi:hypothetical protein